MIIFKPITGTFIKYLLLITFMWYYAGITLFYHSHIINNRTIYHSHPYFPVDDHGVPIKHSHDKSELSFIQSLTTFLFSFIIPFVFVIPLLFKIRRTHREHSIFTPDIRTGYGLRAPPPIYAL